MAAGGLIIGILCGLTAALLLLASGAGWLLALAGYAVFGSMALVLGMVAAEGGPKD